MSQQRVLDKNDNFTAAADASTSGHEVHAARTERNRRIKNTIVSGVILRPLTQVSALIVPYLLIRNLGGPRYGVFEATIAAAAMITFTNAGLTLGLLNRLIDCHVSDDRQLARRYMSSLMVTLAGIMAVTMLAWAICSWTIPWARVLKVTAVVGHDEIKRAVFIAGAATLLGMVFNLPTVVYSAYQELNVANFWDAASKFLVLAATFAVAHRQWGLLGAALATCCVPTATSLANMLWIFLKRPWLRPSIALFDRRLVWSTLSDGLMLSLLQLSVALLFQADKFVIGAVVGAAAVPAYAFVGRFFLAAYSVCNLLMAPLWPAYGEALRRGDVSWALRAMRASQWFTGAITVLAAVVMLGWGNHILRIWSDGKVTHASRSLMLAVACMFALRIWVESRSQLLNSVNYLRPQVFFLLLHSVLNLGVAILAGRRFGVEGVAWATPITSLMTSGWGYPMLVRRYLRRHQVAPSHP
jgi:O-antigen/teichoic acid export membrane protein